MPYAVRIEHPLVTGVLGIDIGRATLGGAVVDILLEDVSLRGDPSMQLNCITRQGSAAWSDLGSASPGKPGAS